MTNRLSASKPIFPINYGITGPYSDHINLNQQTTPSHRKLAHLSRRPVSLDSHLSRQNRRDEKKDNIGDIIKVMGYDSKMKVTFGNEMDQVSKACVLPPIDTKPCWEGNNHEEIKHGTDEVLNLPVLHQSKSDRTASVRDHGTIRKSFEFNRQTIPVTIQGLRENPDDNGLEHDDDRLMACVSPSTAVDLDDGRCSGLSEDSCAISPFPPVERNEVDKHRHLNEEAEKNSSSKKDRNPDYLKRLKLVRRPLPPLKLKDPRREKNKAVFKRAQTKQKLQKDIKDESFQEKPEAPVPKPVEKPSKPTKLIIGFRYSHAVEEYYRGKLKSVDMFLPFFEQTESIEESDEVKNGWLVKTIGAKALNLQARTLPSCNPVELRMRAQHARMLKHSSQHYHRSVSRDSVTSRSHQRSRNSFVKMDHIAEGNELHVSGDSGNVNGRRSGLEPTDSISKENIANPVSPSVPTIHVDRAEPITETPYENDGHVPFPSKSISLSLPMIVIEE